MRRTLLPPELSWYRNNGGRIEIHKRAESNGFLLRLSINPVGGVGGSQPSDCQSGLAGFHGRTKGAVKTCFGGKDRQWRAFSTR